VGTASWFPDPGEQGPTCRINRRSKRVHPGRVPGQKVSTIAPLSGLRDRRKTRRLAWGPDVGWALS